MKRRQVLLAAAAASPALWTPRAHSETNKILLGQSAALTGPAGALGTEFRQGALMLFDAVNAAGGVNGRRIELVSLDDGYEPERCAENTRKFIGQGVFALFGYIGTPTSLAALPLATAAKVPFFAPFSGAESLRAPFNRFAFHVRASYFDETAEIVKQLASLGIKRISVFHQNDSYGKAGLEGVTRALGKRGLEPASLGTVERNSTDVQSAVKSILDGKPDAIVQISAYKSCAAFIRAARAAGYGGTFYNVSFVGTLALGKELGNEASGVVVSQVMPFPFAPIQPIAGEYLGAGRAAHGKDFQPSYSSMEGYVAAKTFVEGLRRSGGNPSQESLVNGLETLRDANLGGLFIDFNAQKHTGSKFVEMTILTPEGRVRR